VPTTPPDVRRSPLRTASVPALALLPLRLFAGATFLYAGFDKLLDPRFFDPSSTASIQAQMIAFARVSPIGGIVRLGEPLAVPIGLAIAIAEIAIGLGGLSGLAFRVAAVGGAILSILFWLTASWATHPYYVGADLPYAFGWIALALAGHGGLLVPDRFLAIGSSSPGARASRPDGRRAARGDAPVSAGRRTVLQTGILAIIALTAASLAVPLRLAGVERAEDTGAADASEHPTRGPAASSASSEPPPSARTGRRGASRSRRSPTSSARDRPHSRSRSMPRLPCPPATPASSSG
jgi:thiosulfate dehydrogenase [quinone] large subunit